ncbi:MAG: SH3 domain-containing protein [Ferruginibacter sp.]
MAAAVTDASVSTSQVVNVREGPSTLYPVLGQLNPAANYRITGKNDAGDWWQIDLGSDKRGWVISQLVTGAGALDKVAVATDIPEAAAVAVAAVAAAPRSR